MPDKLLRAVPKHFQDLTGQKTGKLTYVRFIHWHYFQCDRWMPLWELICECGNFCVAYPNNLKSKRMQSCGCQRVANNITHGESRMRIYSIWRGALNRCNCPGNVNYKRYGGRGIKVLWKSYEEFKADMGPSYRDGLTLERKDVNGNYCKENCCWIPQPDQYKNTRRLVWITFNGQRKYKTEWARSCGISIGALDCRLAYGWPLSEALTIPAHGRRTVVDDI